VTERERIAGSAAVTCGLPGFQGAIEMTNSWLAMELNQEMQPDKTIWG